MYVQLSLFNYALFFSCLNVGKNSGKFKSRVKFDPKSANTNTVK